MRGKGAAGPLIAKKNPGRIVRGLHPHMWWQDLITKDYRRTILGIFKFGLTCLPIDGKEVSVLTCHFYVRCPVCLADFASIKIRMAKREYIGIVMDTHTSKIQTRSVCDS